MNKVKSFAIAQIIQMKKSIECGVEIYHIEGDQVYFKAYCWSDCYNKNNKRNQQHKARVYYNDKHAYFIFKGIRLSLAEALRIDAI